MSAVLAGFTVTATDLQRLSLDNPGWQFERSAEGHLLVSPTTALNGPRNVALAVQLAVWNEGTRFGKVFDSSSGFTMPDGAIVSPDASCVSSARWRALTPEEQDSYAPLCPDVCVELASKTDSWRKIKQKIDAYAASGARYALAINPATRQVYAKGTPPEGLRLDIDAIVDA